MDTNQKNRLIAFVGVIAGMIAIIFIVLSRTGFRPSAPFQPGTGTESSASSVQQGTTDDDVAPLVDTDISSEEEIASIVGDKPLPEPFVGNATPLTHSDTEHVYGNPDAQISIVAYVAMTNSYTKVLHPKLLELIDAHEDVNLVYRHFPLVTRPLDYPLAYIVECVAQEEGNDAFWTVLNELFTDGVSSANEMYSLIRAAGYNDDAIRSCSGLFAIESDVKKDKRDAVYYWDITVVPSYFVTNYVTHETRYIEGANPISYIESVLEEVR